MTHIHGVLHAQIEGKTFVDVQFFSADQLNRIVWLGVKKLTSMENVGKT